MLDGRPINTVIPVDGTTQQRLIEWAFDGTLRVDYFVQFNRMNADHFAALHATKIAITHRIFSAGNVGVITIMPADDHSLLIRAILKVIEQERDPSQQVATPEKRQAYKDRVTQALNEYWAIVKSAGNRAGADRAEMFTMNMTEGGALMAEQMKEAFAMQTALDNCEIDSTHESPS